MLSQTVLLMCAGTRTGIMAPSIYQTTLAEKPGSGELLDEPHYAPAVGVGTGVPVGPLEQQHPIAKMGLFP
jgi:hypothetical protein